MKFEKGNNIVRKLKCLPCYWLLLFAMESFDFQARAHSGSHPTNTFSFIQNKGQWPEEVRFATSIPGGWAFFSGQEFRYHLIAPKPHGHQENHQKSGKQGHVFRMVFQNAATESIREQGLKSETEYNFFIGKDSRKWGRNAAAWHSIQYNNLYPGINIALTPGNGKFKYDFEIEAGADLSQLRFHFEGVEKVRLANGKLVIPTAFGNVTESIPYSYQIIKGKKVSVPCRFAQFNDGFGFIPSATYNPKIKLVIDPALQFFTYSGSTGDNWGSTACGDSAGNGYLAGTVYSASFPTTLGAYDPSYNGNPQLQNSYDIGIQKFNPNGQQLLYCTFLGGNAADNPHSIITDRQNNLILFGTTSSLNFPTTAGTIQTAFAGGQNVNPLGFGYTMVNGSDLVICRISQAGDQLLQSTFLGGSSNDGIMSQADSLVMNYGDQYRGDVAVASDNSVLISSYTFSNDFPLASSHQATHGGGLDGLLFRLSPDFSNLIWSTYFGGAGSDVLFSIHLQGSDRILACGGTKSRNFPTTANAFKSSIQGNNSNRSQFTDACLVSFNLDNGNLLASTLSGTTEYDQAFLVDTDASGNPYIFGQTKGQMPITPGKYGQSGGTIFIQKFNQNLSLQIWQTVIGRSFTGLVPSAFMVDSCERIYFSGWGGDINYTFAGAMAGHMGELPTTVGAIKANSTTESEFYFGVLSPDAFALEYATYFGGASRGEHVDGGMSRFTKLGIITQAVCGCRAGNNFVQGTPTSYSPTIRSQNCNQGLIKMNLGILKAFFSIFSSTVGCSLTQNFINNSLNGTRYVWYFGDGDSLVSNAANISHTYAQAGIYFVQLVATNPFFCKSRLDIFRDTLTVNSPQTLPRDTTRLEFCPGEIVQVNIPLGNGIMRKWMQTFDFISPANTVNPQIKPSQERFYQILNYTAEGCSTFSYLSLKPKEKLLLNFKTKLEENKCESQANIQLLAVSNGGSSFRWTINGQVFSGDSIQVPNPRPGLIFFKLKGEKNACPDSINSSVLVPNYAYKPVAVFSSQLDWLDCQSSRLTLKNKSANALEYFWDFGNGQSSQEKEPILSFEKPGILKISLIAKNEFCADTQAIETPISVPEIPNLITLNKDDKNDFLQIRDLPASTRLQVFNRWGKMVFESKSYQNNWPRPDEIENSVYFLYFEFPNGQSCKDWILVEK